MDWLIVFLANYLILVIGLLAVFVGYRVKQQTAFILAVVLAAILAFDLSAIAGAIYYNPRPFVSQNIEPLIAHGPDNGFPSQHTVVAMTLSIVMYFYRRRLAAVALVLTFLVGAGRVWAHVHSWVDILGGLAIGIVAGYAGFVLAKFVLSKLSAKRQANHR